MFKLEKLVRPNIAALKPYSSAREDFTGEANIFLDANENPFGHLNRYPDPYQRKLKQRLAQLKGVSAENIFLGNGSDEIIDLLFRIFCRPGHDKALTFSPTYGMYQVSADINNVEIVKLALDEKFDLNQELVEKAMGIENLKLIFICSPNNPTGNALSRKYTAELLSRFNGIVVVDEAYADFNVQESWRKRIAHFPNLLVIQTLSKAWGLAGARIGMAFASAEMLAYFNKTKPPYNISQPNQQAALEALENTEEFERRVDLIRQEKVKMEKALSSLSLVNKVFPSEANFILVQVDDAPGLYQELVRKGIVVRNRHSLVNNCLRITIGSPAENETLLNALAK